MHKRSLAHHARRRSNTSGHANRDLVQLLVGALDWFRRRTFTLAQFRLKRVKLFDHCRDRVFTVGIYQVAAFELIGISVADELAQSLQVFLSCSRLIVLFDEWYRQNMAPKVRR